MKKIFLFTLLAFAFFIAPKVNAQVTSLYLFDSSFNTLQSQQAQCYSTSYPNLKSNVKYIRWNFNDSITTGKKYTAYFTVELTRQSDYAWFGWSSNSGININGSYISPNTPTASQTLSQSSFAVASNVYLFKKESSFQYVFTATSTASSWFFQLDPDLGNYQYICLKAYQLQETADSTAELNSAINNQTTTIINNNNSNTQSIIDNQNQNTQDIIDNQNQNTDKEIESQKVCKNINYNKNNYTIGNDSSYLNSSGAIMSSDNYFISPFISVNGGSSYTYNFYHTFNSQAIHYCLYDLNQSLLSCFVIANSNYTDVITPTVDGFIRLTIRKNADNWYFTGKTCVNGNQSISDGLSDLNNNLTSSDVDIGGHVIEAPTTSHPISSIITAPISFLESLDDTCTPISFDLGFPGTSIRTITLPCGDTIFWNRTDLNYVQEFRLFWNILFGGALLYFFGFKLFKAFEKALDPFETGVNDLEV